MTQESTARRIFVGLLVLSLVLVGWLVSPLAEALFLAAVAAATLHRPQVWLCRRLGERPRAAAGLLTAAVVIAFLLPLSGLAAYGVVEIADGVRFVREVVHDEGFEGLVNNLPEPVLNALSPVLERLRDGSLSETLTERLGDQGGDAARWLRDLATSTGAFAINAALMMIALYFFLVDGVALVDWIDEHSPLRDGQTMEILREFRKVSRAVLASLAATAGVQALAALVGYLIAGVPAPLFFAALTFFVALIPAIGGALVVVATAGLMLLSGHPWAALFLVIWGTLAVGLIDNVVKPLVARRGLHLHPGIIFFALIGGLAAFGAVGLLLGPMIVAFFLALVRIHERDYGATTSNRRGDEAVSGCEVSVRPPAREIVAHSPPAAEDGGPATP
ncbi:MAG: AI-2E family transporter [Nannocystaceae bacterium]